MTNEEKSKAYKKCEELRKIVPFNILRTTQNRYTNADGTYYSIRANLYISEIIYQYDEFIKYFNRAKQFFLKALEGEDYYINQIKKVNA